MILSDLLVCVNKLHTASKSLIVGQKILKNGDYTPVTDQKDEVGNWKYLEYIIQSLSRDL